MTAPAALPPGEEILAVYESATDMLHAMVKSLQQAWDGLVNAVRDLLQRAQHFLNADSLWSTITQRFTHYVTDAIDTIVGLMNQVQPEVDKVFATLATCATNSIPVVSLFRTALTLNTTILGGVSGLSADMGPDPASDTNGYGDIQAWRGPAKIAFDKRVGDQMDAANALSEKVKATSGWLAEVGASNTAYLTNLGHMAAELAGELITVAVGAAETAGGDIPQYVTTVQDFSEVIGTAVAHTLDWALDLNQHFSDALAKINEITGNVNDWDGIGSDGTWPRAAGVS